jgi:hypothetical protein
VKKCLLPLVAIGALALATLFLFTLATACVMAGGYGVYLLLTPFHITYVASCKIALGTLIVYTFARIVRDN